MAMVMVVLRVRGCWKGDSVAEEAEVKDAATYPFHFTTTALQSSKLMAQFVALLRHTQSGKSYQ